MVTDDKYNVDILGIGGGPEGVLAVYRCIWVQFQGRFIFDNDKDILRAKKMGIEDLEKITFEEMVKVTQFSVQLVLPAVI